MKITIAGKPLPKLRARVINRHGKVWAIDPQEKEKIKVKNQLMHEIQARFDSEIKEIVMEASNLALASSYIVSCVFGLPIPLSLTKKKRKGILEGFIDHTKKPDLDNLAKFILDVGNGILWKDDSMITELHLEKRYSENPYTNIEIKGMK